MTHTIETVRNFFDWEPEVIADTYEWHGETRRTGLNKLIHPTSGSYLGSRSTPGHHAYGEWLVDNLVQLLDDPDIQIRNFGQLDHWRKGYVQITNGGVREHAGVKYEPFITASTSLDGSFATQYNDASTVIICLNTFQMARAEGMGKYRVKATRNSKFEVLAARDALGILFDQGDQFARELEMLTNRPVADWQWDNLVAQLAPLPAEKGRGRTMAMTKRAELDELWFVDPRVAPWRGTEFGAIQAVSTYEHHVKRVNKGASREDRNILRTMSGDWAKVDDSTRARMDRILSAA